VKELIDALVKQGVEVSAAARSVVEKDFGSLVLADKDSLLEDGHVSVPKKVYDDKTDDLRKYKEESRRLAKERDELEATISAGTNTKVVDALKSENEQLKQIAAKFVAERREAWEAVKDGIPEELKKYYTFPKDEKDELSDEALLANVAKLEEHVAAGVKFGDDVDGGDGRPPQRTGGTPRSAAAGSTGKHGKDAWAGKNPIEKIKHGYLQTGAPKEHSAKFEE
jgi:hypothetical protein